MKAPPPPFIPPVEVNVQQPPPPQNVIANVNNVKPATTELPRPAPPAAPAPAAAPASSGPKGVSSPAFADFSGCAKPEYPKSSLRNEETGVVTFQFLIGTDGSVKKADIVKSSGFRDLDRAAQNALSKCKFKPGMNDGVPQEATMQMQYVWQLDN